MAKGKKSSGGGKSTNDDRNCKKGNKKRPGVSPKAHNGKTKDGYSPAKIALRDAKRRPSKGEAA